MTVTNDRGDLQLNLDFEVLHTSYSQCSKSDLEEKEGMQKDLHLIQLVLNSTPLAMRVTPNPINTKFYENLFCQKKCFCCILPAV